MEPEIDDQPSLINNMTSRLGKAYYKTAIGKRHLEHIQNLKRPPESFKKLKWTLGTIFLFLAIAIGATGLMNFKRSAIDNINDSVGLDLTKNNIKWDLFIGEPISCGVLDCHLTESYGAEEFQRKIVLPGREFPLKGYDNTSNDQIYYRTTIKIPDLLLASRESLKLYTLFVWANHFEIYLNEQLLETGAKEALYVTIPKKAVRKDGTVFLSVKVDAKGLTYQGISNFGNLLVAEKSKIYPKLATTYDIQFTFPLWFLVTRLILCVLFSFFYIFMKQNPENFFFVLYAFFGILKFTFVMDYESQLLPSYIDSHLAYYAMYPLEQWVFLIFVYSFFRRNNQIFRKIHLVGLLTLFIYSIFVVIAQKKLVNIYVLENLAYWIRFPAVGLGAFLALESFLFLAWSQRSHHRMHISVALLLFFSTTLFVILLEQIGVFPNNYQAFINYVVELILFIFLGAATALDFSSTVYQRNTMDSLLNKVMGHRLKNVYLERSGEIARRTKECTILFSDIRNYSQLSNSMTADQNNRFLDSYFELMVPVVDKNNGIICNFEGDGMMALWGALEDDDEEFTLSAVRAAMGMRESLQIFNQSQSKEGLPEIAIGIGIHTGTVSLSEIGTNQRSNFSATGNNTNIASRIEAATKSCKTDILISQATYEKANNELVCSPVGKLRLDGISDSVRGYKVVAINTNSGLKSYYQPFDRYIKDVRPGALVSKVPNNLKSLSYGKIRETLKIA